jgi:hypothetical protein
MRAGYKFTTTDNGVESQYYDTNGAAVSGSFDSIRNVSHIGITDGRIQLWQGSHLALPAFLPGAVLEIDGVATTGSETAKEIVQLLAPVFPDASAGGGNINFPASDGTTWNGLQSYTMSANKDWVIGTQKRGLMLLTNSGSFTFKVYGTSITVNNSGTNSGLTTVAYVVDDDGYAWVTGSTNQPVKILIPVPDTTAPTVVSVEATDATHIVVTFSEIVNGSDAGWSFGSFGITGVGGSGTDTWTFAVDAMSSSDTIPWAYVAASGDVVDDANNPLADDSGTATNSISSETILSFSAGLSTVSDTALATTTDYEFFNAGTSPVQAVVETAGTVNKIRVYLEDVTDLSHIWFKVFRAATSSTQTRIKTWDFTGPFTANSVNEFDVSSDTASVQVGDFLVFGFHGTTAPAGTTIRLKAATGQGKAVNVAGVAVSTTTDGWGSGTWGDPTAFTYPFVAPFQLVQ